jgi:hypothetical protein
MSYWLERINPSAIGRSWKRLRACAKDAEPLTTWVVLENGTTYEGVSVAAVTACIMPNGFALHFIERFTYK